VPARSPGYRERHGSTRVRRRSGRAAMSFRLVVGALRRYSWLALGVLAIELAVIVIGLGLAPKAYTARAAITATPQQSLLESAGNFDNLEGTLAQLVDSGPVLDDVRGRIANARSVAQLRTEVSGARVTGTVLIRVTVVDQNPSLAAEIANAVIAVLPLHDPSGGLLRFADIDRAQPPSSYSSPNVKIVLLVGVVLGVVLAVGAALLRDRVARTVESEDELREAGVDVLGVVPAGPRDFSTLSPLEPSAQNAAAFRAVRVALEFANNRKPIRLMVIASAVPDADCVWLAMNLAVALGMVHRSVLVIDCDGRSRLAAPDVTDTAGLYDVLGGTLPLDRALVPGPTECVTILPSGASNDAAGEDTRESLLELGLPRLIADLGERFDTVLVVARALSESKDAHLLATDGSLLLAVPSRRVRPSELRRVLDELRTMRAPVVGTVLVASRAGLRGNR
jgi:capsular polysaccharide biosynthesis protein/Mrp family chromosome partitioning ATPase